MNTAATNPVGRCAAFSLLEVLCAIAILGVGIVGMTEALTTALRSTKESEQRTQAVLIAAGLMETLRAEGDLEDGETEGACPESLGPFRWRRTVSATDTDGLHEVCVVIEHARTSREVYALQTLLFEPPTGLSEGNAAGRQEPGARKREETRR